MFFHSLLTLPRQLLSYFSPLPEKVNLNLPYFSQLGSSHRWAKDLCGMACLQMILKHKQGLDTDLIHLAGLCRQYGGYVETDEELLGLYYSPFQHFVRHQFHLSARVYPYLSLRFLLSQLSEHRYCIVSVHRTIRLLHDPPTKGGHLVLVTGYDLKNKTISFHNPSGHSPETQAHHTISLSDFNRYFAHRGIIID